MAVEIDIAGKQGRSPSALLNKYLNRVVAVTASSPKSAAKAATKDVFEAYKSDLSELSDQERVKAVVGIARAEQPYGLKDRLGYDSDALFVTERKTALKAGILKSAVVLAGAAASVVNYQHGNMFGAGVFAALSLGNADGAFKKVVGSFMAPKTPEDRKRAQDYADVRHARYALDLLEQHLKKEKEDKLFMGTYTASRMQGR